MLRTFFYSFDSELPRKTDTRQTRPSVELRPVTRSILHANSLHFVLPITSTPPSTRALLSPGASPRPLAPQVKPITVSTFSPLTTTSSLPPSSPPRGPARIKLRSARTHSFPALRCTQSSPSLLLVLYLLSLFSKCFAVPWC